MEDLFKRLMKFTHDGVCRYTFEGGVIRLANQSFLDILEVDCAPEEAAGKALDDLVVHTEDNSALRKALEEEGEVHNHPCHFRTLKGKDKWLLFDAFVVEDGASHAKLVEAIIRDVTSIKQAQADLASEHNVLRALIDNLPDVVYFKDIETRFVVANRVLARVVGADDPSGLAGHTDFDFYPDEMASRYRADDRSVLDTGEPLLKKEELVVDAEGNLRWFSTTKTAVADAAGNIVGLAGVSEDVTGRKYAEDALRESMQRFESVIEHTPLVAIRGFDIDGTIQHWNAACAALYGYDAEEALGRRLRDLLFARGTAEEFEAIVREVVATHKPSPLREWQVYNRRGEERWVYSTIFPVLSHGTVCELFCMDVDITDRKFAEQAVCESEAKYANLFEMFPDAIFLETLEGRVLDCNSAACKIFGFSREELLDLTVGDLVPPEVAEILPDVIAQQQRTGRFSGESLGVHKSGKVFPTEVSTQLFTLGDSQVVLVHVRDITSRKRAAEERQKLEAQIQQAQKLESLGVLAGGIAHDFNNLLTGILGNASLALMELSPVSPARDTVQQIELAAQRAADLTRQMLAYSGRGKFVIQPVTLSEVVAEMTHLLEISISKKSVLKYHFAPNLPTMNADITQLRQVIMNLIINASEAIGDTSGVITITTGEMECDHAYLADTYLDEDLSAGRYIYLEVADTGCGMSPETQARLFDPFFTTKFTGRGLGLAALMGIVRGHHGAVKVYSELGHGTTFKILFPAAMERAVETDPPAPKRKIWKGEGTILVIDDEEVVRALSKDVLESAGFSVITAEDGRQGVELFREHASEVRVIILDLTMPHMDGKEAFTELRRIRNDVPILLSSGYNKQDATERFAGKDLAGFIHKPYQIQEMLETVCNAAGI